MNYYDEQLRNLQEQILRKKKLESSLESLYVQKAELDEKASALEKIKQREQKDVDKLEQGSLSAFFYNIVGKKEEKLDKERKEAYAAAAKYNAAVQELEYVNDSIQSNEAELKQIGNCEDTYQSLLEEKKVLIKESGKSKVKEILELEERISVLYNQKREISEAKTAGNNAKRQVEKTLEALDSAEDWGTWDAWGGGGIFVHMAKYDEMDNAQHAVEALQVELRKFKTELTDVQIRTDIHVHPDDFTRFADWFFDNIFTDYAVLDQIRESQEKMKRIDEKISSILNELEEKNRYVDAELAMLNEKLENIVIQTTV